MTSQLTTTGTFVTETFPIGQSTALNRQREHIARVCEQTFGEPFTIIDGFSAEPLLVASAHSALDWSTYCPLCRVVGESGRPEILAEEGPVCLIAIPISAGRNETLIALGAIATRSAREGESLRGAARLLGWEVPQLQQWLANRIEWPVTPLLQSAQLLRDRFASEQRIVYLDHQVRRSSEHVALVYEEISLLHRLTQNLRLSRNDEELGRLALEWLGSVIPAESIELLLAPTTTPGETSHDVRSEHVLLVQGETLISQREFLELIKEAHGQLQRGPVVVNRPLTDAAEWKLPRVRQLVLVPLIDGSRTVGYMAALNHVDNGEFGSVEANLLGSVGTILGIHSGNIDLYRQRSEFLASVVRALTSAIDAKDPYTRGHSDRVARFAVRLAEQLGLGTQQYNIIYLSGLLHDVGKIGINDQVLRKTDRLTPEEFEHIKTHTTIGYRILADIKQLGDVLPVVLHHHEQWDGGGYPMGLAGEQIPLLARIVAVADAFDAMGSDRPYRKGMAREKLDEVFRKGAGQQWDARVVDAYFQIADELHEFMQADRIAHDGEINLATTVNIS